MYNDYIHITYSTIANVFVTVEPLQIDTLN